MEKKKTQKETFTRRIRQEQEEQSLCFQCNKDMSVSALFSLYMFHVSAELSFILVQNIHVSSQSVHFQSVFSFLWVPVPAFHTNSDFNTAQTWQSTWRSGKCLHSGFWFLSVPETCSRFDSQRRSVMFKRADVVRIQAHVQCLFVGESVRFRSTCVFSEFLLKPQSNY